MRPEMMARFLQTRDLKCEHGHSLGILLNPDGSPLAVFCRACGWSYVGSVSAESVLAAAEQYHQWRQEQRN